MGDKEQPRPDDTLSEAQAKSRSVDERIPDEPGIVDPRTTDALVTGAPGAYVPQAGIGLSAASRELEPGPGERVLEEEAQGVRGKQSQHG